MSTSAEATAGPAGGLVLRQVGYDDPVAAELVERVQQEYVRRYGGRDEAVVDPAEFSPPGGLFLVAEIDGQPAGCGGWRVHGPGEVELKRMYVEPSMRRRGVAVAVLHALEQAAVRAGHRRMVLNSGDRQPEALALYERAGYTPVDGYGIYAGSPEAVFLGRELPEPGPPGRVPGADGQEQSWAS
ncbi:GNAT family N-acetyltransferase [Modestobacter sp. I12A-02628]|uniref:GNAT family N-acetyltransferase n=1 Tax=Goekera deserti TaxID=2497753 RepID=A0A7K3WH04_9ACTN|nr:GNAT family N-acetyltransferase [Goekera deserti]MPQ97299.1 GNAT family N-acetyltransferase [Goekera deserti]NDI50190.1 GNAT family N-acetyltransferase [Goekera deserti]NEL55758.1 GNAT family N-acetyltransferase [Goekera deserti]